MWSLGRLMPCWLLCWLVSSGGQAKELDWQDGVHIDTSQEMARLKKTLLEAQRRLLFRAEVATVKNFRKLVGGSTGWLGGVWHGHVQHWEVRWSEQEAHHGMPGVIV